MRFAFLVPLAYAAIIALGMWAGSARPVAPFAMTALLGAAAALYAIRGEAE